MVLMENLNWVQSFKFQENLNDTSIQMFSTDLRRFSLNARTSNICLGHLKNSYGVT